MCRLKRTITSNNTNIFRFLSNFPQLGIFTKKLRSLKFLQHKMKMVYELFRSVENNIYREKIR
jgi:hypothetical protein